MRASLSALARSGRALSIVPESDVDLTASESSLLSATLLTSQASAPPPLIVVRDTLLTRVDVPLLKRLQRLTREASLQTSALVAGVRASSIHLPYSNTLRFGRASSPFRHKSPSLTTPLGAPLARAHAALRVTDADDSALSAAIAGFLARHDNASIPSAKGLAELGQNVRMHTLPPLMTVH